MSTTAGIKWNMGIQLLQIKLEETGRIFYNIINTDCEQGGDFYGKRSWQAGESMCGNGGFQ